MATKFDTIVAEIKKALKVSQGSDVTVEFENVRVRAFIAGGNVNPGSFRSTWFIDGEKMSKANASKLLQGKA